jgi:hypothetical protein
MTSSQRTMVIGAALILLLVTPRTSAGVVSQESGATIAVNAFYRFHLSHNKDFTARNIQLRRRFFTTEFNQALLGELKRQAAYTNAHPDEVPDYDGDPLTNSQEYPDSFRVGKQVMDGDRARVTVTLLWSARTSRGKDKRDIVVLAVKAASGWLIDDIINDEGSSVRNEFTKAH